MRFEFILIWNHGIQYYDKIIHKINSFKNLKIIKTIYQKINNIDNFINILYKLDNKSIQHIKTKTQYLKGLDKNFVLIFIKNTQNIDPNNICEDIYKLKWQLRNEFNPKFKDSNYHPHPSSPLKKGITHNHIIHANDNNRESLYLANQLGFLNQLENSENYKFNIPIHIPIININNVKKVNIEKLIINLWEQKSIFIKDSPHYNFVELVCNNRNTTNSKYDIYINNILDNFVNIDYSHKQDRFKKLIYEFDINKCGYLICSGNVIKDGSHRASIALYKKINELNVIMI